MTRVPPDDLFPFSYRQIGCKVAGGLCDRMESDADKIVYVSQYTSEADAVVFRTEWKRMLNPRVVSGISQNGRVMLIYAFTLRNGAVKLDLVIAYTDWKRRCLAKRNRHVASGGGPGIPLQAICPFEGW